MSKALLVLPQGFEEMEALSTLDILRRAGVEVISASLDDSADVHGSHDITVKADKKFSEICEGEYDIAILPGGPGAARYKEHGGLRALIDRRRANCEKVAAICAAPVFLGLVGLLEGRRAVCYPGMEAELTGAVYVDELVVTDGPVTTAKGPGAAVPFALRLVELLEGPAAAAKVRQAICLTV
ncbi:MAG: DJ-1/PfpI family protein [Clostridiales bacterium]|nr:DJ-1/PfpI family protein [Clostridiales bacterium]